MRLFASLRNLFHREPRPRPNLKWTVQNYVESNRLSVNDSMFMDELTQGERKARPSCDLCRACVNGCVWPDLCAEIQQKEARS